MKKLFALLALLTIGTFTFAKSYTAAEAAKLKEYVSSPTQVEAIKTMNDTVEQLGMFITLSSEGKTVVYTYDCKFLTVAQKSAVEQQLQLQVPAIKTAIGMMEAESGVKGISIRYIYKDASGNVILTHDFE